MTRVEPTERIVVAFDGSPPSRYAMALACERAKKAGGVVHAVYVIEVKRALPLEVESNTEITKGKAILAQAEGIAEAAGCPAQAVLCRGREVGQALVEMANRQQAQLIILGLGYKERLGTFDLGPTALYLLRKAPCWVWLCRQPPDQPMRGEG